MTKISNGSINCAKTPIYQRIIASKAGELRSYVQSIEAQSITIAPDSMLELDSGIYKAAICFNLLTRLAAQLNQQRYCNSEHQLEAITETLSVMLIRYADVLNHRENIYPAESVLYELEVTYMARPVMCNDALIFNAAPKEYDVFELYEQLQLNQDKAFSPLERVFIPFLLLKMRLNDPERYGRLSNIIYNIRNKNPIQFQTA